MIFHKAEVHEARQVTEDFVVAIDIAKWCQGKLVEEINPETGDKTPGINVGTMFGVKRASVGDYIVETIFDEWLVVNEKTYNEG